VLVLIVVAGLIAYYQPYQSPATPQVKTETMTVDIKSVTENGVDHHIFDPGTVTVHKGDHIVMMVTNTDELPHGIAIPDLNLDTGALRNGQTAKLEFDATTTGTFTMRCSVPGCAPDHAQMLGQLVVVD